MLLSVLSVSCGLVSVLMGAIPHLNKSIWYRMGNQKKDNLEKLATQGTQDSEK
jgi:hypothetical protein